jgi:hypothetical protein
VATLLAKLQRGVRATEGTPGLLLITYDEQSGKLSPNNNHSTRSYALMVLSAFIEGM